MGKTEKDGKEEEDDLPEKTESVSLDLPAPVESESAETVPPADNEVTDQPPEDTTAPTQ